VRDLLGADFKPVQNLSKYSEADQWILHYFNETVEFVMESFENKRYGVASE